MICEQCGTDIILPAPNVRFKKPNTTLYVNFHNSDKNPCWKNYMLEKVAEARKLTSKIQSSEGLDSIEAT